MKMRKMAAAALAAVMAVSAPLAGAVSNALSVVASAAGTESTLTSGDFNYSVLGDGTVEITKYTGNGGAVVIPSEIDSKKVTSIGDDAFYECRKLTEITIPDSVTSIGRSAFSNTGLTEVTISSNVTNIDSFAFYGCVINVDEANSEYCSENGILFNKDKTVLIYYPSLSDQKSYTVPDGVKSIATYAFFGAPFVELTLPDSVGGALVSRSFSGNVNLKAINVGESNNNFCSVNGALYNKNKTTLVYVPNGMVEKSYTIPDGVKTIGYNAFADCENLTEVTIPLSVKGIEDDAFDLHNDVAVPYVDVYYEGTKEDWHGGIVIYDRSILEFGQIICSDGIINERPPETSNPETSAPITSDPATSAPATSDPATGEPATSDPTTSTGVPGDTDKTSDSENKQETIDATLKNVDSKDGLSGAELEKQIFGDSGWTWEQVEKVEFTSDKLFSVQYTAVDGSTKTLGEKTDERAEDDGIWNTEWTLDTSLLSKDKPFVKLIAKDGTADITAKVYVKKDTQKPTNTDQKGTGIALAIAPVVLAAGAVIVISKKRK